MKLDVLSPDQLSQVPGGAEAYICSKGPNDAAEMVKQGNPDVNPRSLALGLAYHCKGVESLTPEQLKNNGVSPALVNKMRALRVLAF